MNQCHDYGDFAMLLTLAFLFVLLGYSIFCFYKRQAIFHLLGAFLWVLFTIYHYNLSVGWDINRGFALFGTLLFLIMVLAPLYLRSKSLGEEEEEEPESGVDIYIKRRDKIKDAARKIRGKDNWEE